jgi:Zn-dependent protease with chaperone function
MKQQQDGVHVSPEFRAEVVKVLSAILKFAAYYILLIMAALGLLGLSLYLGIGLIMLRPSFITLAAGLGIAAVGTMVFVFMVKFIFSRSRTDDPVRVEVYERDQPELFEMVYGLADQVQAPRPKHVYLVPEVNASVSYDSTFWSMFLPVKKNLRIGLGLMNALTVSELRAVIAHEFGHFSQRSMKLGSYVYTVNRTIHDLVQHRDSWDKTLEGWAEAGGVFGWFAVPTFHIVNAVRRSLVWAYGWINRSYSALSRQMEFHADAIAAHAVGGTYLVEALYKVEYAGMAWDGALAGLGMRFQKGAMAADVYAIHSKQIAFHRALDPNVTADRVLDDVRNDRITWRPRLVIKDQWASHPSLDERELHVRARGGVQEEDRRPSWVLLRQGEKLRGHMTELLYGTAGAPPKDPIWLDPQSYFLDLQGNAQRYAVHPTYQGYYDERLPVLSPLVAVNDQLLLDAPDPVELLSRENVERTKHWLRSRHDLVTLKAIAAGEIDVDSFDLDGTKYQCREAADLVKRMSAELEAEEVWSNALDLELQRANLAAADRLGKGLELRQTMQIYIGLKEQHSEFCRVLEKGHAVHARLASKPRFDEFEWKSIGSDAEHVHALLLGHLRNHDHLKVLEVEDSKEQIAVFDQLLQTSLPSTFEVEYFMGVLRAMAEFEQVLGGRVREALKHYTDVQLAWYEPCPTPRD